MSERTGILNYISYMALGFSVYTIIKSRTTNFDRNSKIAERVYKNRKQLLLIYSSQLQLVRTYFYIVMSMIRLWFELVLNLRTVPET